MSFSAWKTLGQPKYISTNKHMILKVGNLRLNFSLTCTFTLWFQIRGALLTSSRRRTSGAELYFASTHCSPFRQSEDKFHTKNWKMVGIWGGVLIYRGSPWSHFENDSFCKYELRAIWVGSERQPPRFPKPCLAWWHSASNIHLQIFNLLVSKIFYPKVPLCDATLPNATENREPGIPPRVWWVAKFQVHLFWNHSLRMWLSKHKYIYICIYWIPRIYLYREFFQGSAPPQPSYLRQWKSRVVVPPCNNASHTDFWEMGFILRCGNKKVRKLETMSNGGKREMFPLFGVWDSFLRHPATTSKKQKQLKEKLPRCLDKETLRPMLKPSNSKKKESNISYSISWVYPPLRMQSCQMSRFR